MITYSTNWMGPVTTKWFEDRGLDPTGFSACAGRIDIRGVPDEPYGLEYALAPMHAEDWYALSDFLDRLHGEKVIPYDTLIMLFEAEYGKKIRWID